MTELARIDAVGLAEMIRNGDLSPVELIDDTIDRIERLNPQVNAVIHPNFESAREAAAGDLPDGPFRGVPMLMKDLWPSEIGRPFHQGVLGLKNADNRGIADANIVTAYKAAGFVMSGRTNTPEMGLSATTEPIAHGPTRNPWDLERGPGGSSGGAAAAVAAGMLPAANASDGGGSIRIPAAMCGLVGLKPSRGRVSMGPQQDEWGNSVQHVVSHTVRDSAAILDATFAPFPGDGVIAPAPPAPFASFVDSDPAPLRIGVLEDSIRESIPIDPEVQAAVRWTADQLQGLGHSMLDDSPPALHDQELIASYGAMWTASVAASLDTFGQWIGRELTEDDVEPLTWALNQRGRTLTALEMTKAGAHAMTFRHRMADWWATEADLLLAPTCLRPAPLIGESSGTKDNPFANIHVTLAYASLTAPFNTTGQPAISLPLRQTETGLPIGLQLIAAYGREDLLIQVAGQLERAIPWAHNRAPMHP